MVSLAASIIRRVRQIDAKVVRDYGKAHPRVLCDVGCEDIADLILKQNYSH